MFNSDNKFDIQLEQGQIAERRLAKLLAGKIEVKSESYLWRRTGNICVEYEQNGKPSGIAATEADWWAHELMDDEREQTVAIILVPVERMHQLCSMARKHENGGDGGRFKNYLIRIVDIFRW